uniref:Ribosomal protein S8 n=1 Tax=Olisthodiscus luteus TaxID=83000 RepID=A0A7U0KT19_OLILU|nr:ribosomal protein S8 [Olisthodiscus luteus]QQW50583.1 ribosomal protein S8 [Olisthodiscus luteus]
MFNDPISDMLTKIRNAIIVKHQIVEVPATKTTCTIASILKKEGLIKDFKEYKEDFRKVLLISLKYKKGTNESIISVLKRVSKPGLRIYSNYRNLPNILNNLGIILISTSKGIMTQSDAHKLKIGGELLCFIW